MKIAVLFALVYCQCSLAATNMTILVTGDWSQPCGDSYGYKLRGRLLICEAPNHRGTSPGVDTAVYLELQECSDFHGAILEVFCNMESTMAIGTNFQPGLETGILKAGGEWELRDASDKPVPVSAWGGAGGGRPGAYWITMPCDSTVQLRATAYNGGRPKGGAFVIDLPTNNYWVIPPHSTNSCFLSGTFTVNPPTNHVAQPDHHLWKGKLTLPKVRIPVEQL
jgi:hypothetical protein